MTTPAISYSSLKQGLERLAEEFPQRDMYGLAMTLICKYLPLLRQWLPQSLLGVTDSASKYWIEGRGAPEDLDAERVKCWTYLRGKGRNIDIKDNEDASIRALLTVLHPEPDNKDSVHDKFEWFAEMMDRIDNHSLQPRRPFWTRWTP